MATAARFPGGVRVMYSATPDTVNTITVATGGAAIGAVSIPVTALAVGVPAGTILDFTGGKLARVSADAAAAATAIAVEPLVAALIAGDTASYTAYIRISEVTSSGYPEATNARNEVTNFDSPDFQEEHIVGFTANGDLTVEANWTGSASQTALFAYHKNRTMLGWKITVPNLFDGDASGFETTFKGQLARCTHNTLTPKDPVKLLLTIVCNSPERGVAPDFLA